MTCRQPFPERARGFDGAVFFGRRQTIGFYTKRLRKNIVRSLFVRPKEVFPAVAGQNFESANSLRPAGQSVRAPYKRITKPADGNSICGICGAPYGGLRLRRKALRARIARRCAATNSSCLTTHNKNSTDECLCCFCGAP